MVVRDQENGVSSPKVLVTGGTSGIGLQLALNLLNRGYEVAVVGLSAEHSLKAQKALAGTLGKAHVYTLDLATRASVQQLKEKFTRDFGVPDILINNAGYATYETFEELSDDELERHISVNLLSHMRVTKAFLPEMIKRRRGQIVNISSVAGEIVITPSAAYCASKQAINAWSRALSYELASFGIDVKVFCPGRVQTGFFDHPTFQRRTIRPEMKNAMSAEWLAEQVVRRMIGSKRFLFHIPFRYYFISWCYRALPFCERLIFRRLMVARVDAVYEQHAASGAQAPTVTKETRNDTERELPTL